MILFRTHYLDERLTAFAEQVRNWSGEAVGFVVDERVAPVTVPAWATKISLTRPACESMGLYCPEDFAWRCGDYGLYLARRAFPDVVRFWLIESDVRIAGRRPAAFFEFFAARNEDFLSGFVEPASANWYWHDSLLCSDRPPYKSFFPLCRINAQALDGLFRARKAQSRSWSRRHFWPNDEGFVATGVFGDGFSVADFNDFGPRFYDPDHYHFETPADGDALFASDAEAVLRHPVLFGDALAAKRARLSTRTERAPLLTRLIHRLDRGTGPSALARRLNAARPWLGHARDEGELAA